MKRKKQKGSKLDANSDDSNDEIGKQIAEDLEKSEKTENKDYSFGDSDGSRVKFPEDDGKDADNKSSVNHTDTNPGQSKESIAEEDYYVPDADDGLPENGRNALGLPGLGPFGIRATDSPPFPRRSNLIFNDMETLAITGKFNELDLEIKGEEAKKESTIMKE